MNIPKFSVERPVAVVMRITSLVLLGAICLTKIPVDLLPKVSIPTVAVVTNWPNVAPEEMETQISRPVEQAVSSAPNIYSVSSSSTQGVSTVRVQFNWGTDINAGAVDVLQLVQRARTNFPSDPTLQSPIVFKYDPSTLPVMIFGVTGISDPVKLRSLLDNEVSPILESANGVASATVTGGLQRSVIVDVDPAKLQAYGLSLAQIQSRIVQENLNLPAGIAKQGNTEFTIRSVGYFTSPKDAAAIPVGTFGGANVLLGMVANVRDAYQEQRISTRLNGSPAVGVIITKQSAANTIATAQTVQEKLKTIAKSYPELKFALAYDQSGFISNSIDDLKNTALIGGSLAVLILMFFLRNIRSTLVVALSIPISIISTFALIYFCGFTLNTISLSGLALASGLIVDDAVVVLENIFRHIERDKRRAADAAVTGSQEIMSAVIASTLTIIIVFLPLLLLQGQSGQMFTQFALVVIFSIGISLLDATTVVPMLASRLIKEEEVEEEAHPELRALRGKKSSPLTKAFDWAGRLFNNLDASYHRGLQWAIHHRFIVLAIAFGLTGAGFLLVPMIGSEMLPQTDSGNFTVNVKLPVGSPYSQTDAAMKKVEKMLLADKDVQTVFSAAGTTLNLRGSATAQISYQGSATVQMRQDRKLSTQDTIVMLQKELGQIPGIRALVTPYDLVTQILTGGATNIEVDVFGNSNEAVSQQAQVVLTALKQVAGLESVDLGVQDATPELQWKIDRQKASQLGVSFQDIASALSTATSGALSSYYQEKGYQYPIYVQVPESKRKSVESLLQLPITPSSKSGTPGTKQVLLGQIATPFYTKGPNEITRLNRQRYIAVTGRVQGRSESEVQADITTTLNKLEFPSGTYWAIGQQQQRRSEEFSGLGLAIFLAVALIYMLLASQFESFIYPLVVLTSVPLCALGVILAMFISGRSFGLTAFIGILMLIGIVVKNGILLVDYTTQLRSRGMNRDDAVLTASPTRLRPILMTSAAAILGMMPLALGIGRGSETQAPLATAVVGGLTTSTILTLFIVPVVYTLFDDLARILRKDPRDLASANLGPTVSSVERKADAEIVLDIPLIPGEQDVKV